MDNSRNVKVYSLNNSNFLDPNHGEGNVPIENLSISVDLYVMPRNRSFIGVVDGDENMVHIAQLKDGSAPFFEGSKTGKGDKSFSFTTDYTDVGDNDHSGRETLGITSINIDFNSAYMPLITMEMVDIRGRHHEMGYESPYNAFFNFPYPIFKLVVKGYYGQPVEYMLHLTRYNAKLDYGSGNYHISCGFNGYTYAYLSDMLLGYLKAVPYTTIGNQMVQQKKLEDPNFLTFDELYEYAKALNKDILSIKEDDPDVQKLAYGYKALSEVKELKDNFIGVLKGIDSYNAISFTGDFVFINPLPDNLSKLTDELADLQRGVTTLDDSNTLEVSLYQKSTLNYFTGVTRSEFLDAEGKPLEKYNGVSLSPLFQDQVTFEKLAKAFQATTVGFGIDIFYFKPIIDDLNKGITKLTKALEQYNLVVTDKFFENIEELQVVDGNGQIKVFDFNIKNYIKVLCDHVDILMNSIKTVSYNAENNPQRNSELLSSSGTFDINKSDDVTKIYAFPDYKKKVAPDYNSMVETTSSDMVLEDYWIGNDHDNIDEVRFIKELYDGMVKNKTKEQEFQTYLENVATQWYPINPFDCLNFVGNNNAWTSVGNTNTDTDIIRLMMYRALIFLGITVKEPTKNEVDAMAKLEANNAFINIVNPVMRKKIAEMKSSDTSSMATRIREMSETLDSNVPRQGEEDNTNFGLIAPLSSDKYKYVGTYGEREGETNKYYLPLTPERIVRTEATLPLTGVDEIAVSPENARYFSNYTSDTTSKPDDGALYFDILKRDLYSNFTPASDYGNRFTEKLKQTRTFSEGTLNEFDSSDVLFNGGWLSNDFIRYDSESNGEQPFYAYFYENETSDTPTFAGPVNSEGKRDHVGKTISGLFRGIDNNEKKSLPHINFYVPDYGGIFSNTTDLKAYSLFGSEYYYSQNNDYAKALLFLHSLPFKGLEDNLSKDNTLFNSKIINLFNQKSGIIEVPYTWVLFIGGLLYRTKNEILLFEKDGKVTLPSNDEEYDLPGNEDFLKLEFRPLQGQGHCYDKNRYKSLKIDKTYRSLDILIKNLPDAVKGKFINEFESWVSGGSYRLIADQLEIFKSDSTYDQRALYWVSINNVFNKIREPAYTNHTIINQTGIKNYGKLHKTVVGSDLTSSLFDGSTLEEKKSYYESNMIKGKNGVPFNFGLELKDGSTAVAMVLDLLNSARIVVNGTWRIWTNGSTDITVKSEYLNSYIISYINEFHRLNEELNKSGEKSFGMTNSSDIYLTIYKNIKSIKDKWVNNFATSNGLPFANLIKTFKFIDRGYNDIGKAFKLNPMHVTSLLSDNHNTSLYAHISKVLSRNNFDFIPMPNYIDYTDPSVMSTMFHTYSYNAQRSSVQPAFVCMYVGERSNVLESNSNFPGDTFNFNKEGNDVPGDFQKVPAFLVRYGDMNQSIFKDLELDQAEFSETNESLQVTDQIASSYNNLNNVGQNLFNIYNNRAYNSKVEMLGNAMIQPFMYYQLDNVPMFRGAYVIIKVTHQITPNTMTTKFTGNRVKRARTKLLDKVTIFNSLIGNFSDIKVGDNKLSDFMSEGTYIGSAPELSSILKIPECDGMIGYGIEDESIIQLTTNFTLKDFAATDGVTKTPLELRCGIQELAINLQVLRDYLGKPIIITNGYRTDAKHAELLALWESDPDKYNKPEENSQHRIGRAADIKVTGLSPSEVYAAITHLIKEGQMANGGLGLYNSFVHYDIRLQSIGARW